MLNYHILIKLSQLNFHILINNYGLGSFSPLALRSLSQDLFLTASENHVLYYHSITNTLVRGNTGFDQGRKECCFAWLECCIILYR